MDSNILLKELLIDLNFMDECHIKNDINTMLKKVHECMAKIKNHLGEDKDE